VKNKKITKEGLIKSYKSLIERARLDLDFIFLTAGAAAICSFGFKMNSPAVIVGAMVISPLLYSVVSIGASFFEKDWKSFKSGLVTLSVGLMIAIGVATIINLFFFINHQSEIVDRLSSAPVDYFLVAFFSGLVGTFAFFWPDIIEAVAGIAISVALIPPVVMVGIGIANWDTIFVIISLEIILINILGIFAGSYVTIWGLNIYSNNK